MLANHVRRGWGDKIKKYDLISTDRQVGYEYFIGLCLLGIWSANWAAFFILFLNGVQYYNT